jgi:hypothetical protein
LHAFSFSFHFVFLLFVSYSSSFSSSSFFPFAVHTSALLPAFAPFAEAVAHLSFSAGSLDAFPSPLVLHGFCFSEAVISASSVRLSCMSTCASCACCVAGAFSLLDSDGLP